MKLKRIVCGILLAMVIGLANGSKCNGPAAKEGYLLTYLDEARRVHVRFSSTGESWQSGTFPYTQPIEDGIGMGTAADLSASGFVYLLAVHDANGLWMWNGLGASNWAEQAVASGGSAPTGGSTPAMAYAAPGKWLVAFRTEGGNLALRVYNASQNQWVEGNFAPQTSGVIDGPTIATYNDRVILAWMHTTEGLVGAVGRLSSNGIPMSQFSIASISRSSDISPPSSNPFLTQANGTFYLGYIGRFPAGPQTLMEREELAILKLNESGIWVGYGRESNPTNADISLWGIASRSDGSVLAIKHNRSQGFVTSKFSPATFSWTTVNTQVFNPNPSILPFSLMNTGRLPAP